MKYDKIKPFVKDNMNINKNIFLKNVFHDTLNSIISLFMRENMKYNKKSTFLRINRLQGRNNHSIL